MTLKSNLSKIAAGLTEAIDTGVEETAADVKDLAAQLAPVDEGDLRASVRVLPKERDGERIVAAGDMRGPNKFVDYAVFVEYGNGNPNYPAQPFMTPAAEQIKPAFRVGPHIKALVERNRL